MNFIYFDIQYKMFSSRTVYAKSHNGKTSTIEYNQSKVKNKRITKVQKKTEPAGVSKN